MTKDFKINDYKILIALVGLPARGKSFTSSRLSNYLNWYGIKCKIFNAGEYRRNLLSGFQDSNFFDARNNNNQREKEQIALNCLSDLLLWLRQEGDIAIFDATNTTIERRNLIKQTIDNTSEKIKLIFLEMITNNQEIINQNLELKMQSPDYINNNKDSNFALEDFKKRMAFYEDIYQTLDQTENYSFIKKINVNEQIILNKVFGITESLITNFLMNLKIVNCPIYLSRHGQSQYNIEEKIGGDSSLSDMGIQYAVRLSDYLNQELNDNQFTIFTSCLKRTNETASYLNKKNANLINSRLLNEIQAGICENLSISEVKHKLPHIITERNNNKLVYRYPEGESYLDIIERLQYFILQILSIDKPIVIIAHQAINRVLLGYIMGYPLEQIPHLNCNLNEVIKFTPNSKGYTQEIIKL